MISPRSLNQEWKDVNFLVPQYPEEKKNHFLTSVLLICVESLVTESADGNLEHLGSFPPVTPTSYLCQVPFCWPSGFLPCRRWLGSKPSSPLVLGLNSKKRLYLTKSYTSPNTKWPFPSLHQGVILSQGLYSSTPCWSRQKSCASQPELYLQPLKVGSFLALGTNSLLVEDHVNIMDTFFTI